MKARFLLLPFIPIILVLACCQKEEDLGTKETPEAQAEGGYFLSVEAAKGINTKALSLDGSTLNAHWTSGEKVGVYVNGAYAGQLLATPKDDATKATLSGTLTQTSGIVADATLLLLFPDREDITEGSKWDYTHQHGAAPDGELAAKFDYATATLTVSGVDGNDVTTTGSATFQNEQSVYRFDFKVGGNAKTVKSFTLSSSQNQLVTSRSYSSGWTSAYGSLKVSLTSGSASSLYMSLRNENTSVTDTYSFQVMGGDDALYSGTKAIPADKLDKNGKFLAPSITLSQPSFTPVAGNITDAENIL